MEGQSSTADSQYQYQSAQWSRLVRRNTVIDPVAPSSSITPSAQLSNHHVDIIPNLLPQQPSYHQAQLAHYNRLISAARGTRLQSSPLPPLLSAQHIQAVPGTRSSASSANTAKIPKAVERGGYGNKESRKPSKGERVLITEKESAVKMPAKKMEISNQQLPMRPLPQHQNSSLSQQSVSVPSTPHQHARKFSFESREPSPTATNNHSPRSAYSESNLTLPSARPIARGGCRYETALAHTKRRIPYSIGAEKLEKLNTADIKSKLSKDEERKLTTDMRELYDRLLPTNECEVKRTKLVQKLEKLFNDEWPGHNTRVHVFGSSGNLLCTDQSDVDICITTDMKEMEGVCIIADLLAKNGMEKVICVSTAKVPIVKIWDPELGLHCDMNVNNTLALENTRMIRTYVQIDDRVRPLAMIIKHWTKRRIVNDAAFGGTLSSYTWICMIINFLQSRKPPVLPALHQRPHLKLAPKDGIETSFADDLDALKGLGQSNKETLGELLFEFFRFYAHEFDYDNLVISVRNGKQISKVDKGWHITNNNRLCVEEPFNVSRNLGNTADDTSFRGLHIELRRAFELISQAKLEECCEEYIYPKEETPVWERPKAKPIVIRSMSTNRGGRGGSHRGGGRHGQNNRNGNGNGNRRASSVGFDHNHPFLQNTPQNNTSQEAWLNRQAQAQLHNDLYATYSVLQAQENSLRLQLYAQNLQVQAFAQSHSQAQAQALGNVGQIKQQVVDRNRGNSFDQGPMTAPIRPDTYYWPLHYPVTPNMYGGYPNSSTNPSSPSLSSAVPELRRSIHRSTVTNGSGPGGPQSSSSLRSHSQPAARSVPQQNPSMSNAGLGIYQGYRQASGSSIPNFIADENHDPTFDSGSASVVTNPEDTTPKEYIGYYVNHDASSPMKRQQPFQAAIPAFGDIGQSRRRLSTDQLPQSILERLKRPSRSPSPLGHERSFSTGAHSAPLTAAHSQHGMSSSNLRALNIQGPLIVNGSNPTPLSIPHWQAAVHGSPPVEETNGDMSVGSIDSQSQISMTGSDVSDDRFISGQVTPKEIRPESKLDRPLVVNGSTPVKKDPEPQTAAVSNGDLVHPVSVPNGLHSADQVNGSLRLSPKSRNRLARQSQNGGMSPLDIGLSHNETLRDDLHNLSPVYETRTPSPTANRKFDSPTERRLNGGFFKPGEGNPEPSKQAQKPTVINGGQSKQTLALPKANGHTRAAKSEGAGPGTWQMSKGKKKGTTLKNPGNFQSQSEKLPVNESERKGG